MTDVIYQDFSLNFSPVPGSGDVSVVTNENSIRQSIKLLVLTNPYERLFQEKIFSRLRSVLFEPVSPITINILQKIITDVINNYEPRAVLLGVNIVDSIDNNAYDVTITFASKLTQQIQTFNLLLSRVR